ncbi:MAG TPA: hypothetical protein VFG76_02785 [Candidatus Polarisedimenticolia bacterium]|nr:hypothetical protein [Candidatus Polarisedimenticolia bacterium]
MKRKGFWLAAVLALVTTASMAGMRDKWLHVRVEDGGSKHVKVNLPISMLQDMASAIDFEKMEHGGFHDGKLRIDDSDMNGIDLRAMWEAVRKTDDAEFVTVQSDDATVRVAKDHGYLVMRVRRNSDDSDGPGKVEARLPLDVVDALLSGEDNELNFHAALRALAEHDEGDLVMINDAKTTVRIWIDGENDPE